MRWRLRHDALSISSTEKVVGTATPKEPDEENWNAMWHFSTGDELMLRWQSSASNPGPSFCLRNQSSSDSSVRRRYLVRIAHDHRDVPCMDYFIDATSFLMSGEAVERPETAIPNGRTHRRQGR